ncbi:MAG TPA: tetratricopeptide repeat protein [Rudaea sp.]|nr:tetratricopeptide repeat protein [Rudaea sp.]
MSLLAELKQRKLVQWAVAYVAAAFALLQGADIVAQHFGWPESVSRFLIIASFVGFFVTALLAWYHGERGAQKVSGTELLLLALLLAIGGGLLWKFAPGSSAPAPSAGAASVPAKGDAATDAIVGKSIAVLPFVNMSADPAQEYFSDGIAEELLNRLAQFTDLKVAARTSAFQFKGRNLDIGEIGRQLKVAHVLEGSVRKSGSTVRITGQLIDCRSGYHLWSETYDRDATDVFKVQDEIAGAIASALEARLSGRPAATVPARTASPAAYDDYLQGRAFVARRRVENLDKAITAFDRAIAKDPGYSAAWSGRAFAYSLRPLWESGDWDAALRNARPSAEQALRLDPDNAEAYMVRGMVALNSYDATSAGADLDRAIALAPGSVDVINMDGDFHLFTGALGESEREKREAMALDPLSFVHPLNLADALIPQRRYAEAVVAADQSVALGVGAFGYDRLVIAHVRLGRIDAARAAAEKGCAIDPASILHCLVSRVMLLAVEGKRQPAKALLDEAAQRIRSGKVAAGAFDPTVMAFACLEVGDIAGATHWQRSAIDEGYWFPTATLLNLQGGAKLPEEISRDPPWLAVWADPRMTDLMAVYRRNLLAWRAGSTRHD